MATTFDRQHHTQQTHFRPDHRPGDRLPNYLHGQGHSQGQSQSTSKIMAILALLPIGGILLGLSGLIFVGTLIGLALATPVFVIFSPVIVPAVLTIGLAVIGFLTSGTFGVTGLSSLSYLVSMFRQSSGSISMQDQLGYLKDKAQDFGDYAGQKTKDVGQTIQNKANEMGQDQDRSGSGQGQDRPGVGVHVQTGGKGGKGSDRT